MAGKVPHHRRLTAISDLVSSIEMMMMMAGHQESLVRPLFYYLIGRTHAVDGCDETTREFPAPASFIHTY